ncbi:MAG: pseudouridine synthase [Ignavibacteria bacterium]|nr:pseudouridine synthase [Ignavibacteria bacterium]
MIIAFHKPYGVLSQFSKEEERQRTLAEFGFPTGVYPVGRLDADSEGLLILSDEKAIVQRLLDPVHAHPRTYWVEVEREPADETLFLLSRGVRIAGHETRPCTAVILDPQPDLAARVPPVRFRKDIPTCWIAITLREGKNRQVRRMTASVGHPTLRLIRISIGAFSLGTLALGMWQTLSPDERRRLLARG